MSTIVLTILLTMDDPARVLVESLERYKICEDVTPAIWRVMNNEAKTVEGRQAILNRIKRDSQVKGLLVSVDTFVFLRGRPGGFDRGKPRGELLALVADAALNDDHLPRLFVDTYMFLPHQSGSEYSQIMIGIWPDTWANRYQRFADKGTEWFQRLFVDHRTRLDDDWDDPNGLIIDTVLFWELLGRPIPRKDLERSSFILWHKRLLDWWSQNEQKLVFDPKSCRIRQGSAKELADQKSAFNRLTRDYEDWAKTTKEPVMPLALPSRLPPKRIGNSFVWIPSKPAPKELGALRKW